MSKIQKAIYELQKNAETFVKDPEQKEKFDCWLQVIEDDLTEERIGKHLSSSLVLRRQFEKLVPEVITKDQFWKRYLFKKALLEDQIAFDEAMEKRKEKTETNVKWEHENLSLHIDLSEEEQIKLLEEYENEIKNKEEKRKCDKNPHMTASLEQEIKDSDLKINKVGSAISLDNSSSTSSTDSEWEKVGYIDK